MSQIFLLALLDVDDLRGRLFQLLVTKDINITMLVLRFVCKNLKITLETHLKAEFPQMAKPKKYQMCKQAASSGNVELLKWVHMIGFNWDYETNAVAAFNGHLEVLRWTWEHETCCESCWDACESATSNWHPEAIKWGLENGHPWDSKTCYNAAFGGHLEVLKWARANGCPWNCNTCVFATRNRHLEVVKWIHQNGCPCEH